MLLSALGSKKIFMDNNRFKKAPQDSGLYLELLSMYSNTLDKDRWKILDNTSKKLPDIKE